MKLVYQNSGNPVDLTSCSQIVVNLPLAAGGFQQLNLTSGVAIVSPTNLGQFTVLIDDAVSALLQVGEGQFVDVTFTISSNPMTIRFWNALSVFEVG